MRIRRILAALLAAMMLLTILPAALTEESADAALEMEAQDAALDVEAQDAAPYEYDDEDEDAGEESQDVDPEAELAEDAGDTGLTVETDEDVELEYGSEASDDAVEADGDAVDALEDDLENSEGLEILALPVIGTGYAAVAPEVPVYADAAQTQAIGVFPDGAAVYVEALENDGALLRVRFDTEDNRAWDQAIMTGYVLAIDALAYTDEEADALDRTLAADARTRYLDGVAIPCVAFTVLDFAVLASDTVVGLGVASHSQAEIQAFVDAHPSYRNQLNIYRTAASDKPYKIGLLSEVNQQSALNMVNQIRYIAGLDANVSLLTEQEENMAATGLVLRLYSEQYYAQNGTNILTHYPPRAAAIADASYDTLYSQGYAGAGRSNIAMGYTVTSALLAYMSDADDHNIQTVGHRRWILNPKMGQTIFGANGRFSAMYAHDLSGAGGQTRVAWPAQEMPYQYFKPTDPWSLSYGRTLDADQVSVSLVRVRDGKTWNFSKASSDGYFNVENSGYGQRGCVIFRPSGLTEFKKNETFNVSVTDGANNEVTRYTVRIFDLDLTRADPMDALTTTAVKTPTGNEIGWNSDARATGYYVCRRASTSQYYQIVADVTGTSYKDTAVSADQTYYYQVYAHNASIASRSAVSVEAKPIAPTSVTLSATGTVKVYRNATLKLSATLSPSNAMSNLKWKSSRKKVATVDANGVVHPKKNGTTVISVTAENGKSATVKVKIVNPPKAKKVTLNKSGTIRLNKGETLQLSGTVTPAAAIQKLTWKSSKKKVATVSSKGLVKAKKAGTATITAKTSNGKKAKVKIVVVDPKAPTSITLNYKGTVTLKAGEKLQLSATIAPDTAKDAKLTWTSSRKKYATVSSGGLVIAKKAGTVTITAKAANGNKATVKIKVVK